MRTAWRILGLSLVMAGCAFGTNHVKLPSTAVALAPERGATMRVEVKDARPEVSGAQVGFKRNGYGAKTGSVEIGEPLAGVLARDLVSLLRERGYRAQEARETGAAELLLDAEIVNFLVDVKQGFWSGRVEGISVVRLTILDAATRRQIWNDVVRAEASKPGIQMVSESDHQEVVERLYHDLLVNIRTAVPDGREHLGGLSQTSGRDAAP